MKKFTLIGHPLGHSMSPFIHSELFKISGVDGEYDCTDLKPENFSEEVKKLKMLNGYNVTIPYKRDIMPYMDELDETAKRYGAVNCVFNDGNKSIGYNTDCTGFLMSCASLPLSGKVLLIGCGGVGRMMALEAALHKADLTIGIIPEASKAAAALSEEIYTKAPGSRVHIQDVESVSGVFDLIINASPVGMYPNTDACPVSLELIGLCSSVFDAVYNPIETKFIQTAKSFGKTAINGTSMLVYQAVKAHEIWNGSKFSDEDVRKLINKTNELIAEDFK